MGDTKGGFLDMLRSRFKKIKLFFQSKRKKELKEFNKKLKKEKLKRKKEEELIYINLNRNIKNNNKQMIIPKENKTKKHLGINAIKIALVPTTLILTGFRNDKKVTKKDIEQKKQTNEVLDNNLQKEVKTTNISFKNADNTQKSEQKQNNNQNMYRKLQNNKNNINDEKENKNRPSNIVVNKKNENNVDSVSKGIESGKKDNLNKVSYNISDIKQNPVIKKKLNKKNKGIANIFNPKKLNNKLVLIKLDFRKYKKINNELEKKLEEQKIIYEEFNKKIKEITPEKRVHVKYYFINNLLHNFKNILLVALSIPLLKKPKNVPLFAVGLYIANNSIRNMRKLITKEEKIEYIPSKNYIGTIKNNLYGLELVEYMMEDSLSQLEQLESDFIDKFSIYKDTDLFKSNINEIRKYKSQLKKKSEKLEIQKEKMNSTMEKNQKVLSLIKDMNS